MIAAILALISVVMGPGQVNTVPSIWEMGWTGLVVPEKKASS